MKTAVLIAATVSSAVLLMWGAAGLAPFGAYPGPYGDVLNHLAAAQRHVLNVATAINFDYRGFDTLIEEYIFFTAVCGISMLFRREVGEHDKITQRPNARRPVAPQADGIGALSYGLFPVGLAFALYVAIHGTVTPGGGFQAGAIAGSIFALVFLGLGYRTFRALWPDRAVETLDALGAGGYAIVATATAIASGIVLRNVLPVGTSGSVISGGTVAIINMLVFIEVTAGFFLTLLVFFEQTRARKRK